MLAVVGFVGYWGAIWVLVSSARVAEANGGSLPGEAAELRAGIAVIVAMVAHAVGLGVAVRASRGQRLLPALLNGISLAIQVLLVAAGWKLGADVAP